MRVAEEKEDREETRRLLDRCAAGETEAWDRLIEKYGGILYAAAGRFGRSHDDVREMFLYIMEELWRDRGRRLIAWQGRARFSTYLSAVAARLCLDRARTQKRRAEFARAHVAQEALAPSAPSRLREPRGEALRGECVGIIGDLVDKLPDKEKAVLHLFYWQGMRYREIASVLAMTCGEVGKILLQARDLLRAALSRRGIGSIEDILE